MKTLVSLLAVLSFSLSASADDQTKIIRKLSDSGEKDSSVLIQTTKGAKIQPDFEIMAGEEEIMGDPTAGVKEALKSWKEACAEWKKELKENNKDGQVLYAGCGTPKFKQDDTSGAGSGVYTYRSDAKYKVRVRIKDK